MLVWQAYEAQKIWTGRTPDFKDMKIALLENLQKFKTKINPECM